MASLTITVEDDVRERARMKAPDPDASVNSVLRDSLRRCAGDDARRKAAIETVLSLSRRSKAAHGRRRGTRDEFHERRGW